MTRLTLKLTNGATAVIDNCRACCYGYDQRAEVFGDKGCVAISNDSDSNAVFSEIYMTKAAEYFKTYYPVFLLGAVFAKIMEEGGLAAAVANKIESAAAC